MVSEHGLLSELDINVRPASKIRWTAPKKQHLRLTLCSVYRGTEVCAHVHAHTYTPHTHLYTHTNSHTEREITQLESKHLKIITKLNLTLKIRKMNKIVTDQEK